MLSSLMEKELVWFPEIGLGHYPVSVTHYDDNYFDKYAKMAKTEMGKKITQHRVDLVSKYYKGPLVDVGIGCGSFVENRVKTFGYDINEKAVSWLKERNLFVDIYSKKHYAMSFWDSFEHIKDIDLVVNNIKKFIFMSIPIFTDCVHLLGSHHFRKDEHFWYFTDEGIINFLSDFGFSLLCKNDEETRIGRDSIMSYVFRRD